MTITTITRPAWQVDVLRVLLVQAITRGSGVRREALRRESRTSTLIRPALVLR
ncbi:hypothetical protein LuPra_02724 [Luteitalea pratensis]|uniref:Uncharacterized protein n=1 Tax=Luteitalea pratensis TaxID=1855912 RepID=A0A143PLQ3_LUTPR|nr:hypothetical protein [Luteitalea pratensis]AMY09507.1 hypothetical protein LuPra_02724 [Luteitalea pratensis]